MDLLQGVKEMADEKDAVDAERASILEDSGAMPSPDELLRMLEGMTGLSEQDKEELRASLLGQGTKGFGSPDVSPTGSDMLLLLALLAVIFSVLVFFFYKLYKSLVEKERKRDEKRKMKQMKKKK